MVEISKDARVVIQIEASRLHGYTERNVVRATVHLAVGRDPQNPALDDDVIRTEKLVFDVVVNKPEIPGEWTREIVDALDQVKKWIKEHVDLDIGAFEKYAQPIRIVRGADEPEVGVLDEKSVRVVREDGSLGE